MEQEGERQLGDERPKTLDEEPWCQGPYPCSIYSYKEKGTERVVYVGQTSRGLEGRDFEHLRDSKTPFDKIYKSKHMFDLHLEEKKVFQLEKEDFEASKTNVQIWKDKVLRAGVKWMNEKEEEAMKKYGTKGPSVSPMPVYNCRKGGGTKYERVLELFKQGYNTFESKGYVTLLELERKKVWNERKAAGIEAFMKEPVFIPSGAYSELGRFAFKVARGLIRIPGKFLDYIQNHFIFTTDHYNRPRKESNKQQEKTRKPKEETRKPQEEYEIPQEGNEKPQEGNEKPQEGITGITIKEAAMIVLQESKAGPAGMSIQDIRTKIEEKFSCDYANKGLSQMFSRQKDVFAQVSRATYALWACCDDDVKLQQTPKFELIRAVQAVLEAEGRRGATCREIAKRMKQMFSLDVDEFETYYKAARHVCLCPEFSNIVVQIGHGIYSLAKFQEKDFQRYENPKEPTLADAITKVLGHAGKGGSTIKKIEQIINEKQLWRWKEDQNGYYSIKSTCRRLDSIVGLKRGTYALLELQDDKFDLKDEPMELKEAIITVLEEAGQKGLRIIEIAERICRYRLFPFESEREAYDPVASVLRFHASRVFQRLSQGTYALKDLLPHDFDPNAIPKNIPEAITRVLEQASEEGKKKVALTKEAIVNRIIELGWPFWKDNPKQGPETVRKICSKATDVYVKIKKKDTKGVWWALTDNYRTPYERPKTPTLCDAIFTVLKEAALEEKNNMELKEIEQQIKEKKLYEWEPGSKHIHQAIGNTCRMHKDIFCGLGKGVYALKSLQAGTQAGQSSSHAPSTEKVSDSNNQLKREREGTGEDANHSEDVPTKKMKKLQLEDIVIKDSNPQKK